VELVCPHSKLLKGVVVKICDLIFMVKNNNRSKVKLFAIKFNPEDEDIDGVLAFVQYSDGPCSIQPMYEHRSVRYYIAPLDEVQLLKQLEDYGLRDLFPFEQISDMTPVNSIGAIIDTAFYEAHGGL
jgi:hypothetical protein